MLRICFQFAFQTNNTSLGWKRGRELYYIFFNISSSENKMNKRLKCFTLKVAVFNNADVSLLLVNEKSKGNIKYVLSLKYWKVNQKKGGTDKNESEKSNH